MFSTSSLKVLLGSTLTALGQVTVILGLSRVFRTEAEAFIGLFLVVVGTAVNMIAGQMAGGRISDSNGATGRYLYLINFVSAVLITVVALFNIFSTAKTAMILVLLFIGFAAAISAASNAIGGSIWSQDGLENSADGLPESA